MATIQGVYVALFGRPADPIGLQYWKGVTNDGADLSLIGDLAQSQEYQDRFVGQSQAQIVNSIYRSLFNRDSDAAGLTYWVNGLNSGEFTINDVAIRILDGAQGADKTVVDTKITAADLYTASLDTGGEIAAYSGNDAAADGRLFLSSVSTTVPDQATVDAAIAAMVAENDGSVEETFTLTVNQDTATANVFYAPTAPNMLGGEVQTLNAVDSLKGNGEDATLNATLNTTNSINPTLSGIEHINLRTIANSNIDLGRATGVQTVTHIANSAGADLTVLNIGGLYEFGVSESAAGGNSDTLFQLKSSVLAGSADAATVTLTSNGAPGNASGNINIAGNGAGTVETLNVKVNGANNISSLGSDVNAGLNVITTANGTTTYNFSGDGSIRIGTTLFNATTVNAAGLTTGGLNASVDASKVVKVTGGAGGDNINFGAGLTNADSYAGGAGRDTLQVSGGNGLGAGNQITEVEILQVNGGAAFTFDNDLVASIDTIVHNSTGAMEYKNLVGANASSATEGVTILNTGSVTASIKGADGLGATNDAIHFNIGSTGGSALQTVAGVATGAITANNIEKISIDVKADGSGQTASGTGAITANSVQTLNITGGAVGEAFSLGSISNAGIIKIDANAFTGNLTLSAIANADDRDQIIIGGSGDDVIRTGGGATAGNDGGRDLLTGGAGNDTFILVSSAAANAGNDMFGGASWAADVDDADGNGTPDQDSDVLASIDAITDLNLGGANVGSRVDLVQIEGTGFVGAATVLNGGAVTALTGAGLGAALDALFSATGQLGANGPLVGLFSFGGQVFLAGTIDGDATAGYNEGQDFIINVTGVTGTLDASDFAFI